tara:strand:+ start:464 stop:721 length:258 start_codon:yes stop_codon:yes gene_type:complete
VVAADLRMRHTAPEVVVPVVALLLVVVRRVLVRLGKAATAEQDSHHITERVVVAKAVEVVAHLALRVVMVGLVMMLLLFLEPLME